MNLENGTDRLSRNVVKPLKEISGVKPPKNENLKRINTLLNSSKCFPKRCEILDIEYFNLLKPNDYSRTTRFNNPKFYMVLALGICVLYDLTTNSDLCLTQS